MFDASTFSLKFKHWDHFEYLFLDLWKTDRNDQCLILLEKSSEGGRSFPSFPLLQITDLKACKWVEKDDMVCLGTSKFKKGFHRALKISVLSN